MSTDGTRRFHLPDLGEGLEDATIVAWHVAEGDHVAVNQPLCTVETAKAEVEIPSPFEGEVTQLAADVGDTVPVGELLAEIGTGEASVLVGYGTGSGEAGTTRARRPAPARTHRHREGPARATEPPAAGPVPTGATAPSDATVREIPVTGVRARIAAHLTESHRDVPTAVAIRTMDCTAVLALRDTAMAEARRRGLADVVTPFAVLAWAVVRAVQHVPVLNSSFDATDAVIRVHPEVHLGVATSTERGLVVPVVRSAQRRGLLDLAAEVQRLASEARAGSLGPGELIGSTITVSNFGALGLDAGIPVLNPPEAAILGIGAVRERAVVRSGAVVARPTVEVACVFDHRAADGAEAAELLAQVARLVEDPAAALLDPPPR